MKSAISRARIFRTVIELHVKSIIFEVARLSPIPDVHRPGQTPSCFKLGIKMLVLLLSCISHLSALCTPASGFESAGTHSLLTVRPRTAASIRSQLSGSRRGRNWKFQSSRRCCRLPQTTTIKLRSVSPSKLFRLLYCSILFDQQAPLQLLNSTFSNSVTDPCSGMCESNRFTVLNTGMQLCTSEHLSRLDPYPTVPAIESPLLHLHNTVESVSSDGSTLTGVLNVQFSNLVTTRLRSSHTSIAAPNSTIFVNCSKSHHNPSRFLKFSQTRNATLTATHKNTKHNRNFSHKYDDYTITEMIQLTSTRSRGHDAHYRKRMPWFY